MLDNNLQIEKDLFEYIGKNTHDDIKNVTIQSMLFREGIFDSMGFILLIDFIEEKYGIRASDEDLIEENFKSITAITNYIQRKRSTKAA